MIFEHVLERRAFLLGTAAVAISVSAGCSGVQTTGVTFSEGELRTLTAVSDTIIPDTDVPGAVAAKVPEFIDGLMEGWADDQTRRLLRSTLNAIDEQSHKDFGKPIGFLADNDRLAVVSAFDMQAFDESETYSHRPGLEGYRLLKAAILDGYFLSNIGANEAARYQPVPGTYVGCVELEDENRRVWATR